MRTKLRCKEVLFRPRGYGKQCRTKRDALMELVIYHPIGGASLFLWEVTNPDGPHVLFRRRTAAENSETGLPAAKTAKRERTIDPTAQTLTTA